MKKTIILSIIFSLNFVAQSSADKTWLESTPTKVVSGIGCVLGVGATVVAGLKFIKYKKELKQLDPNNTEAVKALKKKILLSAIGLGGGMLVAGGCAALGAASFAASLKSKEEELKRLSKEIDNLAEDKERLEKQIEEPPILGLYINKLLKAKNPDAVLLDPKELEDIIKLDTQLMLRTSDDEKTALEKLDPLLSVFTGNLDKYLDKKIELMLKYGVTVDIKSEDVRKGLSALKTAYKTSKNDSDKSKILVWSEVHTQIKELLRLNKNKNPEEIFELIKKLE